MPGQTEGSKLSPEELVQFARYAESEARFIELCRFGRAGIELCRMRLRTAQLPPDELKVLTAIAVEMEAQLRRFEDAPNQDIMFLAWASRNLYELKLILLFVVGSPENLRRFSKDWINDEVQLRELVIALKLDRTEPEIVQKQQAALERLRDRQDAEGLPTKKPLTARQIAKSLGKEQEFDGRNKFYSKLVHPTSFSVLGGTAERVNWDSYRLKLLQLGTECAADSTLVLAKQCDRSG